jgi:hypothetical protein
LKNYENRLKVIKKLADGKSARVIFVDYKNGKYYKSGTDIEVDIDTTKADTVIVDDIPCDEDLSVPPAQPESLKGSDID